MVPALCVALVLALPGCGGGGSGDAQTQGTSSTQASTETSTTSKSSGQKAGADPTSQAEKEPPAPTTPSSPGAKHGERIKLPKGEPERAPSAAEKANSTLASMDLESSSFPALGSEFEIPATYTCDGKGTSPELHWSGVPRGTAELVLFALNLEPINEALFFDWAVANLDPSLEEIKANQLPKGAILGKNSFGHNGYQICPQSEGPETYIFALYALPRPLSPHKGFDPATLREEILALSGNVGLMAASYARG